MSVLPLEKQEHIMVDICDFCSEQAVAWRYPARTFAAYVVSGIVGESVGDWAACPICHGLIQDGLRVALAERSLQTLLEKHPEMRFAESEVRAQIRGFHTMFFSNRIGDAVPITAQRQTEEGGLTKEGHS
jgi:hypothetical protein